jgi:hypothetical protein
MGQCGEFGYALWAAVADLVPCYGPQQRIWLGAVGHCDGFGHAPRATAVDWLCALGLCAE